MSIQNPVKQLKAEVARKIAAGEVIDRPCAIVRELMDNAVDSGADNILVEITGGGIEKVRTVDNGCGMTKEDLCACARPHATSKISSETDLLKLSTLGFRGEALSSIAAVCRLTIISGGYKMCSSITEDHIITPVSSNKGCIVQAEGLFENFPARRVFLKRPASEALMCKHTFIEKSLPCPQKSFRFISDGNIKLDLPAGQTLKERFVTAMEFKEDFSLFYQIEKTSSSGWSFKIIIGEPGVFRNSKKDIYIYVNGRRITEYSLVQAIEYGGKGYFPNGTFPAAVLFATISPELVDFNIHPAKREARFKNIFELHHGISTALKDFFSNYTQSNTAHFSSKDQNKVQKDSVFSPFEIYEKKQSDCSKVKYNFINSSRIKDDAVISSSRNKKKDLYSSGFAGTNWNLIKAKGNALFAQQNSCKDFSNKDNENAQDPAESEKFIENAIKAYNRNYTENDFISQNDVFLETENRKNYGISQSALNVFKSNSMQPLTFQNDKHSFRFVGTALGTFIIAEKNNTLYIIDMHAAHERILFNEIMENQGQKQILIVPYTIEATCKEEDEYLESIKSELNSIGFECKNTRSGKWEFNTIHERWVGSAQELHSLLLEKRVSPKDIIYSIAASAACKAAVKDGWIIDNNAASEIAEKALELPEPHCPHGRPVYTSITREQLFSLVRRT